MSVTIESKLESRFPEIIAEMRERLDSDVEETAKAIAERAAENVNIGPIAPHIADEIHVEGAAAVYEVTVGSDVSYAKWVEFGRKHAPPYPFLMPAAEAERQPFEARVSMTLQTL